MNPAVPNAKTSTEPIDFYFDFISGYGYFASLRIDEIATRHGRRVNWNVTLLGVMVMKVMGLKPLLETPLKSDYVLRDAARYTRQHGLQPRAPRQRPDDGPAPCCARLLLGAARAPATGRRFCARRVRPLLAARARPVVER